MIKGINGILISSENPQRLIEFYNRIGVELKISDHGGGVHAETDFGDVHFAIWGGGSAPVKRNNVCFSFHVPNLEEYYEKLSQDGVIFDSPPTPLPFGGLVAELTDPDGNRLVLMRWESDKA